MTLRLRLESLAKELKRTDTSPGDKLVHVANRGLVALRLTPRVEATRRLIVELAVPPKAPRGLSDLIVRRGGEGDVAALCSIANADPGLVRARLARGDLVYVGQIDEELLCHTWFHQGPTSFDEERLSCASWALEASTFWSYDAVARVEWRSSGVFAKMFQVALREVFDVHGARRVQGFIFHVNRPSLSMHARLGFSVLGVVTTVALPGVKWLRWEGSGVTRQWLLPRASDFALSLPPR